MTTAAELLPARYRSPQRIGRGGMGDIYRATDTTLGRAVAIKLLAERYAEDDAVRDRFTREALTAARLSSDPNAVTIYDVGEWRGRPFIVMEYLGGGSLEDQLRRGTPDPADALRWLEQAAVAIDAAHRNGIVHRDVKPANLLLNREGNVHVADFGIASAAGLDSMTMTGTILGTAGYLSPEQAQGDRATPASDRYALAVVAFELLTGRRPFERDSATAEAAAHVHEAVPSVCARAASLPCELDPVFDRALAKNPGARYPTSADFVADLRATLQQAAGTTGEIVPVPPPAPPVPSRRRPLLPLWAGLGAVLLSGGVLAAVLLGGGDDKTATPGLRTVTRQVKVTLPNKTVKEQVTVTTSAEPATTPPATTTPRGGGSISEGISLTDQATALMGRGDYAGALQLAQRALSILDGSGETYEGYANFNVGKSLAELGRCDEALPYLEKREQLLGAHPDVRAAKKKCGA
jgi:eukaryotic-like serine/threonine-protein kinase